MGLWHVFYEDWQMECCGRSFSVGEEVRWPVLLDDADDVLGGGWDDALTSIAGPAVVRLEVPAGDGSRHAGLLRVERHGDTWPELRGRVRAVQVVIQAYDRTPPGSSCWQPVPGQRRLRPVERCPKWFSAPAPEAPAAGGERRWSQAGAMATLEVPDLPSTALTDLLQKLSTAPAASR
ncbi:DUF6578 domain-containing protein [Streptomyces sp. NPDC052682]|uniref:DUF6578 domain-containing protein n=1 Tax=Streptomyces sp. NPDC052682 TaxID=3154954 RepID=UPI003420866A